MSPAEILPNTLFICGPLSGPEPVVYAHEINIREESIKAMNVPTFNPARIFTDLRIEGMPTDKLFNYQISCLAICEKVITLRDWERCELAQKMVAIARIMNKPIIPYSKFILKNTKS